MVGNRRSTFNWAAAPDEGDAAAATSDIEAWLASQAGPTRDWETVLGGIRDVLSALCVDPRVLGDPICRDILASLPETDDPEALDAAAGALLRRIEALLPTPRRADAVRAAAAVAPVRRTEVPRAAQPPSRNRFRL